MSRVERLVPQFVGNVPENLALGVIYVAAEHGVMMHLCACGCGSEVSLPLSPIDWRLTFDGDSISVSPSVGNWSLPCRSHYVIDRSQVQWAADWTDEEVEAGRSLDRRRKKARHDAPITPKADASASSRSVTNEQVVAPRRDGLFITVRRWISEITKRW